MNSTFVHILSALFGMAAWLAVNGVWVELPLLVNYMPEGWDLASQLVIVIQCANIAPLVITLLDIYGKQYLHLTVLIYILLVIGVLSQFLLFFFWDWTVNGKSIPFFILFLATSIVDCASSVSFIPFMSRLQAHFLQSYFLGEGLSGFVPAIAGLIQGVGNVECNGTEPNYQPALFGVDVFFLILSLLAIVSLIAYSTISVYGRDYYVEDEASNKTYTSELSSTPPLDSRFDGCLSPDVAPEQMERAIVYEKHSNNTLFIILFILCFFANGFYPAISTFTAMPYGLEAYHASTILNTVANPVACIIANYRPVKSRRIFYFIFFLAMLLMGFNLVLALGSPCPIMVDTVIGSSIMVICTTLYILFTTLLKVSFASTLREEVNAMRLLLYFGAVTQIGSFFGALVSYPLVIMLDIFTPRQACQECLT